MKIVRPADEAEVVSYLLKSEFHHREYHADRDQWENLVLNADFSNAEDNALRRRLLDRRHAGTWTELPSETTWSVCELDLSDLGSIHVSPGYHWPTVAPRPGLTASDIVSSIREARFSRECTREVTAIQVIAYRMRHLACDLPVLLIGPNATEPLTVLAGDRHLIAAALAGKYAKGGLRGYAGLSRQMRECFLYRNTPRNYVHHAQHWIEARHPWILRGTRATWNLKAARWARLMLTGTRAEWTHEVSR